MTSLYLDPRGEEQRPLLDEDAEGISMVEQIQELQLKMETLENRLKDTIDSTLNREEGLRASIETMVKEAKECVDIKLQRFDQVLVDCLKRRDKRWGVELEKTRNKNRSSWRPASFSTGKNSKELSLRLSCPLITRQRLRISSQVQSPTQCIQDFAYDHRALCLRWRPDMVEDEIVRRILSACNPRLASGSDE